MFKQTEKANSKLSEVNSIINKLGAISSEQQQEFANLTGRFNSAFKIGKPSNIVIGKSIE